MLNYLKSSLRVDGLQVDTVLYQDRYRQGEILKGEVRLFGGVARHTVNQIDLRLVTICYDGLERSGQGSRNLLSDKLVIEAREEKVIPFTIPIGSDCPSTSFGTFTCSLFTDVDINFAVDTSDLDEVIILPNSELTYMVEQLEEELKWERLNARHHFTYQAFIYAPPEDVKDKVGFITVEYRGDGELGIVIDPPLSTEIQGTIEDARDFDEAKITYQIKKEHVEVPNSLLADFIREKLIGFLCGNS